MVKKTWSRTGVVYNCGNCEICQRKLLSNQGGWIINSLGKRFCIDHSNPKVSCFDQYIQERKTYAAYEKRKKDYASYEKNLRS